MHSQPRKPIVFWAASGEGWPADQGRSPRPHEIPPVVLFPHVESSTSLQHGIVGLDPEEKWSRKMVHKNGQSGTCPLRRQAERLGVVQPGEVKDPGRC